jgi:hypothetical protein
LNEDFWDQIFTDKAVDAISRWNKKDEKIFTIKIDEPCEISTDKENQFATLKIMLMANKIKFTEKIQEVK